MCLLRGTDWILMWLRLSSVFQLLKRCTLCLSISYVVAPSVITPVPHFSILITVLMFVDPCIIVQLYDPCIIVQLYDPCIVVQLYDPCIKVILHDLCIIVQLYDPCIIIQLYDPCIIVQLYDLCIIVQLYDPCIIIQLYDPCIIVQLYDPCIIVVIWSVHHSTVIWSVHLGTILTEQPNNMKQCIKILLFLILNKAQHVSGDTPPIIRSLKLCKQPVVLRNTICTVLGSWWWAVCCPKHVELHLK
jgi:hypothetical protein